MNDKLLLPSFPINHHSALRKGCLGCLVALLACLSARAEAPQGYYDGVADYADRDLKDVLHELLYTHTLVSSYNALPQYFLRTDVYPEGHARHGQWWDMYTDVPEQAVWDGNVLNREHSLPKSWWGGDTDTPAYVDLFHLYPAERRANLAKSNWPLGEVDVSATPQKDLFRNDLSTVGTPVEGQGGGARKVFEPGEQYKGDFARTYFYMATAYQNLTWKYTYMVGNDDWQTLNPWSVELLLRWSRQDPVSAKETLRNDVVYTIQHNRNPFIDHPELAELIWGDRQGEMFDPDATGGIDRVTDDADGQGWQLTWCRTSDGVRLHSLRPHTGLRVYDLTGRLLLCVAEFCGDIDLSLPLFQPVIIVTDQAPSPIKIK